MEAYDRDRKRPLEIRVRPVPGGLTDRVARGFGRVTCDGFVLVRFLLEEACAYLDVTTGFGAEGHALSTRAIFDVWVALTGHLARQVAEDAEDARRVRFARQVLGVLGLDEHLVSLVSDPVSPPPPADVVGAPTDAAPPPLPR